MLLPMLSIYQEYVRNHHYSLQVLTHCKQSSPSFAALLTRLEKKTACGGRTLDTFLTYPMDHVSLCTDTFLSYVLNDDLNVTINLCTRKMD